MLISTDIMTLKGINIKAIDWKAVITLCNIKVDMEAHIAQNQRLSAVLECDFNTCYHIEAENNITELVKHILRTH